jgi:signal transduction histidine kinase
MEIVGIFNTISFVLILIVVILLVEKLIKNFRADGSLILIIISFCILLFVTFTNVLEHLEISSYFDLFEDEVEIIFIPLFIFAVFSYSLEKELKSNLTKEQSIKENNFRLYTSVKGASQALWEWHPQSNSIIVNKEYYFLDFDLLFYTIDDNNWQEIIHPESRRAYSLLINSLQSKSVLPENTELQLKTFYGNYKWVLIRGAQSNLNFENQGIGYLGTIIDIGSFKNVQFELEHARIKAEESERLKTAFLNNISHEIRTPMNAIVGFSELIIEPGVTAEKQKSYMSMIVLGCERLIQIIEDLIEMSKIISGIIQINTKTINSKIFCTHLIDKYSAAAKIKKNKLSAFFNSDFNFSSDETKLTKIFSSLLENAIKYTRD